MFFQLAITRIKEFLWLCNFWESPWLPQFDRSIKAKLSSSSEHPRNVWYWVVSHFPQMIYKFKYIVSYWSNRHKDKSKNNYQKSINNSFLIAWIYHTICAGIRSDRMKNGINRKSALSWCIEVEQFNIWLKRRCQNLQFDIFS